MESPFLSVGMKSEIFNGGRLIENRITVFLVVTSMLCIVGLHPQSPLRFAWKASALLLRTLKYTYLSHIIAPTTVQFW